VIDVSECWVIDSSSIIGVRETVGRVHERRVFAALTSIVGNGQLRWPPEVTKEVEEAVNPDYAVEWVRSRRTVAEITATLDTVKSVLQVAPSLVDADAPRDQADPYVVALALDISSGDLFVPNVTIITEDRRDKPNKLSLATAAGLLRIPTVPIRPFLLSRGIPL
jgi:hypothetical protein